MPGLFSPQFKLKFNSQARECQGASLAEAEGQRWQHGVIQSGSTQRPLLEIVEQSCSLHRIHTEQEENWHCQAFAGASLGCNCRGTGGTTCSDFWSLTDSLLRVGCEPHYLPRSLIPSLRTCFTQGSCVWLRHFGV